MSSNTDPSFSSDSSRMGSSAKRQRTEMEAITPPRFAETNQATVANTGEKVDAWNDFESMMKLEMTAKYF